MGSGGMGSGSMGSGSMGSGGGGMGMGGGGGGYGGSAGAGSAGGSASAASTYSSLNTVSTSKPKSKKGGMRLGKKGKKDNEFVEQLMAEGQAVTDDQPGDESGSGTTPQVGSSMSARSSSHGASKSEVSHEGVHLNVAEKITVEASRDGGVENLEVKGIINMLVSDPDMAEVKVKLIMDGGACSGLGLDSHDSAFAFAGAGAVPRHTCRVTWSSWRPVYVAC